MTIPARAVSRKREPLRHHRGELPTRRTIIPWSRGSGWLERLNTSEAPAARYDRVTNNLYLAPVRLDQNQISPVSCLFSLA